MTTVISACARMCTCSCQTHFSQFWSPLITFIKSDQGFEKFNENSWSKKEKENINFFCTGENAEFLNPSEMREHMEGR